MECLRSRSVLWVSGVFLLFVIYSAARIGAADLLSGYARNKMNAWSTSATRPDVAALESVAGALGMARRIAPDNPDYLEYLVLLTSVRADMPGINDAEKNAWLGEGLLLIRQAIALRPASAYSYATLLLLKQQQGEYDAEFRRALERAVTLGPWEPYVQRVVADAGMSAWAALPRAEQEMVRENIVRGMKWQSATMLPILQARRNDCDGERAKSDAGCSR